MQRKNFHEGESAFDPNRDLKADLRMVRNVLVLGLVFILACGGAVWFAENIHRFAGN